MGASSSKQILNRNESATKASSAMTNQQHMMMGAAAVYHPPMNIVSHSSFNTSYMKRPATQGTNNYKHQRFTNQGQNLTGSKRVSQGSAYGKNSFVNFDENG